MKQKTNKPDDNLKRNMEVGLRIRRERLLWDMTQEELSEILGISTNYLGQIERGNRELSRNMEERLCQLFNLTHNDLIMTGKESGREFGGPPRVSEAGVIFNDLNEEDIVRLLHSCTPGELQLCGHVIRSMLLYLRNPASPKAITARLDTPGKDGENADGEKEEPGGRRSVKRLRTRRV